MKKKVLFLDETHPFLLERLEQLGFSCINAGDVKKHQWQQQLADCSGVVVRSSVPITKAIIDMSPNLKFIARVGAGLESIDVDYAAKQNILLISSPEGNRHAVGEHALGMLLCLLNHLCRCHHQVRQGIWQREANRGTEIRGKTVGIIGYGNMGSAFAEKLSGFSAKVIAYDKYKFGYSDSYVTEVSLNTIFTHTDILSLHVPLTEETRYMVDEKFLSQFQKPITIINTARGLVVKTSALLDALKKGIVCAAALDVLEYEDHSFSAITNKDDVPEVFRELMSMEQVLLSPHVAGWTHESHFEHAKVLADKIEAAITKQIISLA
jgi:D-3-phosphoglycerate dehydrogenase